MDEDAVEELERRPVGSSIAVGVAVAIAVAAMCFLVVAIPLFTLASFEPNGLDRPFIRTGLFRVAGPVGAVIGIVSGALAGRWYRSGRSWRMEAGDDRYTTR